MILISEPFLISVRYSIPTVYFIVSGCDGRTSGYGCHEQQREQGATIVLPSGSRVTDISVPQSAQYRGESGFESAVKFICAPVYALVSLINNGKYSNGCREYEKYAAISQRRMQSSSEHFFLAFPFALEVIRFLNFFIKEICFGCFA
jgi:hypothetical protein